jgi:two-component system, NtrC family, sensor kinase
VEKNSDIQERNMTAWSKPFLPYMKLPIHLAIIVLFVCGFCHQSEGQNSYIDSLKNVLKFQKPDTNKALTYVRLSERYAIILDSKNTRLYTDSALSLARKLSFKRIEASAIENRGFRFLMENKIDSARMDFFTAMDLRRKLGNKKGVAQSYFSIGQYYHYLDSLPEALDNFYHALEIFEKIDDPTGTGRVRVNLGQIYLNQGNDSEALVNSRLARDIQMRAGHFAEASGAMEIMGNIEFDLQNYEKALQNFREAIQTGVQGGVSNWTLGEIYLRIGDTYQKQGAIEFSKGNQQEGLKKYDQALSMYDSTRRKFILDNSNSLIPLGIRIAKINVQKKNYTVTRQLLEEYFKQPQNIIYYTDPGDAYAVFAELDSAEGNYKKAWEDYKMYIHHRDSIYNVRNDKKLYRIRMQHEYNVREADSKILQAKKDEESRISKSRQNLAIFALIVVVLAVLAIAVVQLRNNKAKQKANKLLENALTDLNATQTQLIQSEKLASLGELTAGIAHEIQNPLNFMNNFSEVNFELIGEMEQEIDRGNLENLKSIAADIKSNEEKISHHGKRADSIVKGMLQHTRSSSGIKQLTDINALADEYLKLSYHGFRAKESGFNANIHTDFDERLCKINIIPQDIGRVFLNLYNNAFYAVEARRVQLANGYEPSVRVSTVAMTGGMELRIADNGNGISKNIMDKIFQPFFTTKPAGQGTGLGLSLSYDIIKAHGGDMKVISTEGEGAEFVVQLPLT